MYKSINKRKAASAESDSDDVSPPKKSTNVKNVENTKEESVVTKEVEEDTKAESPVAKKSKKVKLEKVEDPGEKKKSKDPAGCLEKQTDDEGNEFFELGRNRRASMSDFKGKQMINIREYYLDKKSNKMKPGSKGITLYDSEWKNLISLADAFKFD